MRLSMHAHIHKFTFATCTFAAAGLLSAGLASAQTPSSGPILSLTATTENISGAKDSVRIDLLRWSTDAERAEALDAWNMKLPPAPDPEAGRGGRGGRGGADGAAAGGGGRGGRGRGGRGGGGAAAAPKPTPQSTLAAEIAKLPTVGYLWSSEVAGYSFHYAVKLPEANGGQRILLLTDRRLGAWNDRWKLTAPGVSPGEAANYDFSVIELHLNAKNEGEGKASLAGKLAVDSAAKLIALDDYASLPVIFKSVKRK